MTFREKLMKEHPDKLDNDFVGGCYACPESYGYEKGLPCGNHNEEKCRACWDREIPGTEKPKPKDDSPMPLREMIEKVLSSNTHYITIFSGSAGLSIEIHPVGDYPKEE